MIYVDFDGGALARLRIITSPLWEAVGSLLLLSRRGDTLPWPYSGWAANARRALHGGPATELVPWARRLTGPVPQCLAPVPERPDATIEEELARVLRTDTAELRQYADAPDDVQLRPDRSDADPAAALSWYVDAMSHYWDVAIRPYWPSMRAALSEEVLLRARTLAVDGATALMAQLDERIFWKDHRLVVADPAPMTVRCDGQLVLVPMLFGRALARVLAVDTGLVAVSYQARGAVLFAAAAPRATHPSTDPERGDRLAILVGRSRAAVLRGLATPTTTSGLARSLGLSAATVSGHLSGLLSAEVVQRRRAGVRVLYELNTVGSALLRCLDDADTASNGSDVAIRAGPNPLATGGRQPSLRRVAAEDPPVAGDVGLDLVPVPRLDVRVRNRAGAIVLARDDDAVELSETASCMWRYMDAQHTLRNIADLVGAEYEMDGEEVLTDVADLAADLVQRGLLDLLKRG